jgi:aminoglycoside 6'-N-acetyltransferase
MITFRQAKTGDLELLKYWDTKPHVMACAPESGWNWEIELNRNPGMKGTVNCRIGGRTYWYAANN